MATNALKKRTAAQHRESGLKSQHSHLEKTCGFYFAATPVSRKMDHCSLNSVKCGLHDAGSCDTSLNGGVASGTRCMRIGVHHLHLPGVAERPNPEQKANAAS